MKINSVHLQSSCCQSTPDGANRRGFLYKKSESSRSFHKRWFLLQHNLLFYFSHKRSEDPKIAAAPVGLIVLEGCCVERLEGLSFQLTFPGSGERKYVLATDTEEEREDWMQAMISAGYGFMQYAISEMEQTIDAFATAEVDQLGNARASSSVPDDTGQRVTTIYCPVEVKGGQVTSVEDASLPSSAINESRRIEDQIPSNSRFIFERMHLQFVTKSKEE